MNKHVISNLLALGFCTSALAAPGTPLQVNSFHDANYPEVEPAYSYDFVAPIAADILDQDPNSYTPSYSERYFTSIFGPRYKDVNSSIEYFDFHQGMDFTAVVTDGDDQYDDETPSTIINRCDGTVRAIEDGDYDVVEETGEGRWVEVECDQHFAVAGWGPIFMAYRHLETVDGEVEVGERIDQGEPIGLMDETGHTDTVHLHYSVIRRNDGFGKNVNPMRTFDPAATPHLHASLATAEISQLQHDINSALFRVILPYEQTAIRAITVELEGTNYSRHYDFEAVSANAGDLRDDYDYVEGLKLFAYPYNRGQTNYARYLSKMDSMPVFYAASRSNSAEQFKPFLNRGLNTEPAYAIDVRAVDLPFNFDINDLKITVIDIYGHGVYAYGDSSAEYPSVAFHVLTAENDKEEYGTGVIENDDNYDLELTYKSQSKGNQTVALRFDEVNLPQFTSVDYAHIQFMADETDSEATDLTIAVEDSANAPALNNNAFDLSNRTTDFSTVNWQPEAWNTVGESSETTATSNIASLLQSRVNDNEWAANNAVNFIISGTGRRVAESAENSSYKRPYLYVEYSNQQGNSAPFATVISPEENAIFLGLDPITFKVNAADSDGNISEVRFYIDDELIATDGSAPYSSNWQPLAYGTYSLTTEAEDDLGEITTTAAQDFSVVGNQMITSIATGNDDAEQRESGSIARNGSDLELGYDTYVSNTYGPSAHQTVGLRFSDVELPANAIITNAYVQFTSTKTENADVDLTISAELSDDASSIGYGQYDISGRSRANSNVAWAPEPWLAANLNGEAQRSPNLAALLQEVVNQGGWQSGNAVMLIIEGDGVTEAARTARSYNGNADQSPQLVVEFTLP